MEYKHCYKCKQKKQLNEFHKMKNSKDGHRSICKECRKPLSKEYQIKNKEKIKIKKKEYRENNLKAISIKRKKYREENKEKIKCLKQKSYQKNKNKHQETCKIYKMKNYEKIKQIQRDYKKNRRKTDSNYKIITNMRSRINAGLRKKIKSTSTKKLLGCTIKQFREHLESLFSSEMTWNNYGSYWHIDHILSCSAFELQNSEEQEICFHWTNMRPLEAIENLIKHNKIL